MKKMFCFLLSVVGLSVVASSMTFAAEENGLYAGAGLGRLQLDFSDATFRSRVGTEVSGKSLGLDFDSAMPVRLSGGYNWGRWALELSYEHVVQDVDVTVGNNNSRGSLKYGNFNVGGVYRGSGQLYFLGKLGISQPSTDTNIVGTELRLGTSGFAGAGLGYRFTPSLSVEFDFTRSSKDTSTFMLGLRHHF